MNRKQSDTNQNNQMGLLSHTGINQPVARAPIKSSKVCFAESLMCQCGGASANAYIVLVLMN